jgi:hypothetical protein
VGCGQEGQGGEAPVEPAAAGLPALAAGRWCIGEEDEHHDGKKTTWISKKKTRLVG